MTDIQLWPVIWILASMVACVLGTLFVSPAMLTRLSASTAGRWLIQFTRLIFFIGVPYAALLTRAIAPVDLGLTGVSGPLLGWTGSEWLESVGWGLMSGALVLIPIGFAARQMKHAGHPLNFEARATSPLLIDSLYAEVHWAFYRAAPLILLDNVYMAILIGLGLVGVELLVSLLRSGLGQQPEERQAWLKTGLLLTLSAVLFFLTHNLWVMILTHGVVEVLLKVWTAHLAPGASEPQAPQPYEPAYDPDVRPLNKQPEA